MRKDETYTARRDTPAFDAQGEDRRVRAGDRVVGFNVDHVVDQATGEVLRLPAHIARNPGWYFESGFNPRRPVVALEELAYEVVRCNPGLQVDLLYSMAVDSCPREVPTYSSFTATLSADKRVEMRDQSGAAVTGLRHNKRFCTYHVRQRTAPLTDARVQ